MKGGFVQRQLLYRKSFHRSVDKRYMLPLRALTWTLNYQGRHFGSSTSIQSLSRVQLSATPWTAARQASLSITSSRSLPRLMSIELVMRSSHLILCPLFYNLKTQGLFYSYHKFFHCRRLKQAERKAVTFFINHGLRRVET